MKEVISGLIEERLKFIKTREDSWSEEEVRYTIPEPKEVKELGDKIRALLSEHKDTLPVDFILESLTHLGDAPQVVYDDNGHFAVSGSGFSPVPMTDSGKFETEESFTTVVSPEQWYDTIREALIHYLK
ncbi:MAG: hypothetical protein AABY15_02170 [Nanoarchaeota archaeon]